MKNIAIVCGGNSGEFEISVGSARMVKKKLDETKYSGFIIVIRYADWYYEGDNGIRYPIDKSNFTLPMNNRTIHFDGVFNAIHGTPGEDGKLQAYFDLIGLPYTSCNQVTSALTFNKYLCNRFVSSFGIKVARAVSFLKDEKIDTEKLVEELGLPMFVKPAESGSSVGISKVKSKSEIGKAIELAFAEGDQIVIEEFIAGREFACGLIKKGKELIVFPLTEIITKKDFFDYEAKYTAGMADEITPADVHEEAEVEIKTLSSFLFHQFNCKGFVRFDYILSESGLYFLEVNTVPGITEASIMPKMADAFGMDIKEFFSIALDNLFTTV